MENQKTILLVEDDQILIRMYTKKFEKDGYKVLSANDGNAGLSTLAAANPKPDIILLDVMLPGLNGFEILQKIKADEATKAIPVILLTNLGSGPIDHQKGIDAGAEDYLVKSELTPSQIVEKVKGYIK